MCNFLQPPQLPLIQFGFRYGFPLKRIVFEGMGLKPEEDF